MSLSKPARVDAQLSGKREMKP